MSRPDWCPQWAWDDAVRFATEYHTAAHGRELRHSTPELATYIARAILQAKQEQQAEIDRLNSVIARMQQTMSSQAEQWSRSMAEAEQRGRKAGLEEAARLLDEGYTREVGEYYRADHQPSKHDKCPHGRYVYEDCESCGAAAIRAKANEVKT